MKAKLKYWIAMATYRAWHPLVLSVLMHCARIKMISDTQLHMLAAKLDRTQVHFCLRKAAERVLP